MGWSSGSQEKQTNIEIIFFSKWVEGEEVNRQYQQLFLLWGSLIVNWNSCPVFPYFRSLDFLVMVI